MNSQTDNVSCNRFARGTLCAISILGLSLALDGIGLSFFAPNTAQAQSADPNLEQKQIWQDRYRTMLQNQAILADNVVKRHHDAAQANRRNYPRGGARDKYRLDEEKAKEDLADVKKAAAELLVNARRQGIPRNWFYAVEDELARATPAAKAQADEEQEQSREGRNPLYLDD